jgi:hypothetical protein
VKVPAVDPPARSVVRQPGNLTQLGVGILEPERGSSARVRGRV